MTYCLLKFLQDIDFKLWHILVIALTLLAIIYSVDHLVRTHRNRDKR